MIRTPHKPRAATTVAVLALLVGVLPLAGVAGAQEEEAQQGQTFNRGTDRACPDDAPDAFGDDTASAHHDNINCLAFWDIVSGTGSGTYNPSGTVARDAMATFVAAMMEAAPTFEFNDNPPDAFTDDENSVHEDNINKLADADVIEGTGPTTYSPTRKVQRNAMAKFIVRALEVVTGQAITTDEDFFDDDEGDVFEEFINELASIGVVQGTGGGNYSPGRDVDRASMASFIARGADYLAEQGHWPSPLGENAAYTVSPGTDDELAFAEVREYTVDAPAGTTLRIRLFQATDVSFASGAATFSDSAAPAGVADENVADAVIIAVNDDAVTPSQEAEGTAAATDEGEGNLTFVVQATEATHVTPVVWTDLDGGTDGELDLNADDEPSEPFGLGGNARWTANEAASGTSTPTVQGVALDENSFAGTNGRTYEYDTNDTFQVKGANLSGMAAFESILNPGDSLTVTYDPASTGTSVFNITNDVVHAQAPTAKATDDPADNDEGADDVAVSLKFLWNNPSNATYDVQRTSAECSTGQFSSNQFSTVSETDEDGTDDNGDNVTASPFMDNDQAGPNNSTLCWVYRIRVESTFTAGSEQTTARNSDASNVVEVPGDDDEDPPTITSVVASADNGADGTGDADGVVNTGDEHRFRFDEVMDASTAESFYRVSDADGTIADIVCTSDDREGNADCELNSVPVLTSGGQILEPGRQLTVTLTGDPTIVQQGDNGSLSYAVTIIGVGVDFQDDSGNQLTLVGSDTFIEVE